MERIMIYPYSKMYEPYVRHQDLLIDSEISALVSPRGWGLENEKVKTKESELCIESNFFKGLSKCTTVWFVDDERWELSDELIKKYLYYAIMLDKNIIFFRKQIAILSNDPINIKTKIQLLPRLYIEHDSLMKMPNICMDIDTPIIVVCGLEEKVDKLEIQLALRKEFISRGYKISSISSRRESENYGLYSFPDFMFNTELSETDKIIKYNHYVKWIEQKENPDLFIIGVPGGIFPYDKLNHNHFGITAYEISLAISCDVAILGILYNNFFEGDYTVLKEEIESRYRYNVEFCHIASNVMDVQTILDDGKRGFVSIDPDIVRNKVKKINKRDIFYLRDYISVRILADNVIQYLRQN